MVQYTRSEQTVKHCTKLHIPQLESPIASGIIVLIKTNVGYYNNLLVCAWEHQSENQYYICHKVSSMLYSEYSTVVKNTVQLF